MLGTPKKAPGGRGSVGRSKVRSIHEGIVCEVLGGHLLRAFIISNVSTWTDAAWATRAWACETAHPATNATIKVAVSIANVSCPSEFSLPGS